MPTTVTLDSVTTGDAQPTTAPHRISDKPTKDTAEVRFTVGGLTLYPSLGLLPGEGPPHPGPRELPVYPGEALRPHENLPLPSPSLLLPFEPGGGLMPSEDRPLVRCYRVFLGGNSRETGVEVGRQGVVCGDYHECDSELLCSDWRWPAGKEILEAVTYDETGGPPDDTYDVNIYVLQGVEWNG